MLFAAPAHAADFRQPAYIDLGIQLMQVNLRDSDAIFTARGRIDVDLEMDHR